MRLLVYSDDIFRRDGSLLTANVAFPVFAAGLGEHLERVTLVGRLEPGAGRTHHRVPDGAGFVALPFYRSLTALPSFLRAFLATLRRFWRALGDHEAVWLLGPHPLAFPVVVLALLRHRAIYLGVRQDTLEYAAGRHRNHPLARWALIVMELTWRALALRLPVVVVGARLAHIYRRSPHLLECVISLVPEGDILSEEQAMGRTYEGEIDVLSVGRLDPEKNPLLLADVLSRLAAEGTAARLVVCGDGPLREPLRERAAALGVSDRLELRGYVAPESGLREVYRASHILLHVSHTEGVPQVLFEAFAAGLPTAATDVGGVGAAAEGAGLLFPPDDAEAAAAAVRRLLQEPALRARLARAALEIARRHSREAQLTRLAAWMREQRA